MKKLKIVVDANVIAKTFADESDSQVSMEFLRACVSANIEIIAPDLFKYEIAQIALRKQFALDKVFSLFEQHISTLIELQAPSRFAWLEAEKICQHGHIKSGFPSMYDSVYHAMAIVDGGMFVTADKRHYAKAKDFGHIILLKDWKTLF